jgi:transposase
VSGADLSDDDRVVLRILLGKRVEAVDTRITRLAIVDRGKRSVHAPERFQVVFKKPRNRHWYHFGIWRLRPDATRDANRLARLYAFDGPVERLAMRRFR